MLKLFPELGGSLNVSFQPACSKSKKRFPDANKVPASLVTMELWEEISLDGLVRKHVMEVTHLYITQVPALMARLDSIDGRKSTEIQSWRLVFHENEVTMIRNYLHTPSLSTEPMDVQPEDTQCGNEMSSKGLDGVLVFPDILSLVVESK